MQFLMDADVKQVSSGALEQFNLDVIQCERKLFFKLFCFFFAICKSFLINVLVFTAQSPVPGYDDATLTTSFADTLVMTFADLRQVFPLKL